MSKPWPFPEHLPVSQKVSTDAQRQEFLASDAGKLAHYVHFHSAAPTLLAAAPPLVAAPTLDDLPSGWQQQLDKFVVGLMEKFPWLFPKDPDPPVPQTNLRMCNTIEDVQAVIAETRAKKSIVRVGGAQHSAGEAVFDRTKLMVKLQGTLRAIEHKGNGLFRVGAGCNLGVDPSDPQSTDANSFNQVISATAPGYSLPIIGGISHQTLAGFLMTGSAGGSLKYGFGDVLKGIEFVDGQGNVQVVMSTDGDRFKAAGLALGLFGIVTHVWVQTSPMYFVGGAESTVFLQPDASHVNPVDKDGKSIDSVLTSWEAFKSAAAANTYIHCVWFPMMLASPMNLQFLGQQTPVSASPVPYVHPLQKTSSTIGALVLFLTNLLGDNQQVLEFIMSLINKPETSSFNDTWWKVLPTDDHCETDHLIRVQFIEIWVDMEYGAVAFKALQDLFATNALARGYFGTEIYVAKQSPFWMSPACDCDVFRIDAFWFEYNKVHTKEEFFKQYFDVLMTLAPACKPRVHWGKSLPALGSATGYTDAQGAVPFGPRYCKAAHPNFDAWLAFRQQYDPEQIFVTDYWRGVFGISPATAAPGMAKL